MGIATGSLVGLATLSLGYLGFTATQTAPAQAPTLNTRVTASMNNASMDEVLQWLRKTGVNFVIDKSRAPKDARLNLNIVDKPLRDVMDAVASAVGGSWQKHGDVYSLRQGMAFGTPAPEFFGERIDTLPPMDLDELRAYRAEIAPKIGEELRHFKTEIDPKMLEELKELQMDPKVFEHLKELEIEMPDFEGFVMPPMPEGAEGLKLRMLNEGQIKELIGSLTSKQKEIMKSKGHLTPGDLTPKQQEILKSMGGVHGMLRLKTDDGEISIMGPEGLPEHGIIIAPPAEPRQRVGEAAPAMPMPKTDIAVPMPPATNRWKELSASLSQSQKDLIKKQGFLYDDQLTAAQLRMVSLPHDSNFTLTVSNGKESLTIKSRKQ